MIISNSDYIQHYKTKVEEYENKIELLQKVIKSTKIVKRRKNCELMVEDLEDTLKFLKGKLEWAMNTFSESWEDFAREDLRMIPTMEANGFKVEFSNTDKRHNRITPEKHPQDSVDFSKGIIYVWKVIIKDEYVWNVADLIYGFYKNHRSYPSLLEVIENEK